MELPDTFVKLDYAMFASKTLGLLIEYDTESHKYKLYNGYADRYNPDNWEMIAEYDSIEEAFDAIDNNKALTCPHFSQNGNDPWKCENCRAFHDGACDPRLFDK